MQEPSRKFIRFLLQIAKIILLSVAILIICASLPYALFTTIYDFPQSEQFTGKSWYNPYAALTFIDSNHWKKSNFHGHTKAWGGITDGKSNYPLFLNTYRSMGYHSIGISNYQFIDYTLGEELGFIPCYEHGYNIWKRHHICIGAKEVVWLDFLFGQSIHHKQTMIDRISPTVDVLAIAHPKFRGSFDADDFTKLTGYDCIEVLNHYRTSEQHWDSALSSGHPAWIIADDDTHNVVEKGETGVCWTMIYASGNSNRNELTSSLKSGYAYGVQGKQGLQIIAPESLEIIGDSLYVISMNHITDSIILIGQHGKVLSKKYGVQSLSYSIKNNDTYIRAKIFSKENTLWFNPVFRGNLDSNKKASIHTLYTILYRSTWIGAYIVIGFLYWRKRKEP